MTSNPSRPLEGKQALVCGASRGIGRACALELARRGAAVTVCARNVERLKTVRDEMDGGGGGGPETGHRILPLDFADPPRVRETVARHLDAAGPIQILINNSGGPASGAILDAKPETFLAAFSSHLICNQLLAQLLVPGMKQSGYGRIVNIVSTSIKQPLRGLGVSNTVRGAVASWAKTLSNELAPFGITVNNVLPGATLTDRLRELIRERARAGGRSEAEVESEMQREIPSGRFGRPEEIAEAVGFLAGPSAAYITGVSLPVDGGRTSSL